MSFSAYSKYKDSGVRWLGNVPEHWLGPRSLGAISSLKGRLGWQGLKADEYREAGPYVVSSAHFSDHRIRWIDCPRVSEDRYNLDTNIQLEVGDVLLMKDGAAMGKLAYIDMLPGPACVNSHLLLLRPLSNRGESTYAPKFAFYFLQTKLFQDHIKVNGTGATFLGISQDAISRYAVVWPPQGEQELICSFLDHETAKIDALIAEQETLLALLSEKRQATISHVVTRGLGSGVAMKDSGIAWLGQIPAHWEIGILTRIADRIVVGIAEAATHAYRDDGVPILRSTNIRSGRIQGELLHIDPEFAADRGSKLISAGDLVTVRTGNAGVTAVVPPELDQCQCFTMLITT